MDRRLPLALTLMMSGVFMVVPTPDELLIHPFIGYAYTRIFNIDLKTGIILSIISFNALGLFMILISLIIGGRFVLVELNNQMSQQGKKLGEQLNSLRVSSYPINYTEYNSEGLGILADLKYELFD
ncbi:MAG: hypothetical protein V1710_03810 [Candidatus Bathyarchaeota archaeon]